MKRNEQAPYRFTPENVNRFCTLHWATVKDVKDPEGRGRVRCEAPGLLGKGKKCWTPWIEVKGTPKGSVLDDDEDHGVWFPLQPGQVVGVGFTTGEGTTMYCDPGPPLQEDDGEDKACLIAEIKEAHKENARDATREWMIKTPAGHTLRFRDVGGKELMELLDWTGAGLTMVAPGKQKDTKEKKGEGSKARKGERRGTNRVSKGTAKKPSEVCKDGYHLLSLLGLLGQGLISYAEDGKSVCAFWVSTGDGEVGPSLILDGQNNAAYLTAGKVQAQFLGNDAVLRLPRTIIKELENHQIIDAQELIGNLKDATGKGV